MENRPDLKFKRIRENIKCYFNFLLRRGFHITSVIFADQDYEDWQVTMTADDCLIQVYHHMGKINVALSTLQLYNEVGLFELTDLIDLIKGDADLFELQGESPMNEVQKFQKTAWLLEKYIDEVFEEIKEIPILPPIDDPSKTSLNQPGPSSDNGPGSLL